MRSYRRLIPIFLVIITAVLILFFIFRRDTKAAFGAAVALCPGPDLYGYVCESGTGFAYIDATNDTRLYQDEGATEIQLPFPFTFYGTPYSSLYASSNGTLHFDTEATSFINACLDEGPVAHMGDMIAPFWDDLDLRFFGFLETELVGTAPERIFVIEWDDVPQFNNPDSRVTFEVQLFEESNDIVVLYEDTTLFEGNNGSSATIGLQSAAQGLALQYSCFQPGVADASRIRFTHPEEANADIGRELVLSPDQDGTITVKGAAETVDTWLNDRGLHSLPQLRGHWLSQTPARHTSWEWLDITGNGRSDLILLQYSTPQNPEHTQLMVFSESSANHWEPVFITHFSNRETAVTALEFVDSTDLTQDGIMDVLLQNPETNQLYVITAVSNLVQLLSIPDQCTGSLGLLQTSSSTEVAIIRDGCQQSSGRVVYYWDGQGFSRRTE